MEIAAVQGIISAFRTVGPTVELGQRQICYYYQGKPAFIETLAVKFESERTVT